MATNQRHAHSPSLTMTEPGTRRVARVVCCETVLADTRLGTREGGVGGQAGARSAVGMCWRSVERR